jgi:hypothetical protein
MDSAGCMSATTEACAGTARPACSSAVVTRPTGTGASTRIPVHYPWPMTALVRHISTVTERFFTTGTLPPGGRTVTIEAARG